jgi:hypothetical protein
MGQYPVNPANCSIFEISFNLNIHPYDQRNSQYFSRNILIPSPGQNVSPAHTIPLITPMKLITLRHHMMTMSVLDEIAFMHEIADI